VSKTPVQKNNPTAPTSAAAVAAVKAKPVKSAAKLKAEALELANAAFLVAAPPPNSSRFADRFAPPKPPTRQTVSTVIESPRVPAKIDPTLVGAWKSKSGNELTDAEVLAMPEAEYMNAKQIEFFRAKLTALKNGVLSNAGETTEHLREDTSIVPDPADRATIEEEHALELRTVIGNASC